MGKKITKKKWRVRQYGPNEKDQVGGEITDGENAPFGLRFDVPPQEAIDYFKRKKLLPPDEFYKLDKEAKAGAFSVARVYKMDVIEGFRNELVDALEQGRTTDQVVKRLRSIVDGAGHTTLGTNHLETVVRTTMQMAYGVGRRSSQEDVKDLLPVWEYSAVGDDRTRPTHMALDGLQYPADHPFWNKYYPPWDFRCRCTVIATFDFRHAYDRNRPNDRTVIEYDQDGLPAGANVDGIPMNFKAVSFSGVPSQSSLASVLQRGAAASLKARAEKPLSFKNPDEARSFGDSEFAEYKGKITSSEAESLNEYTGSVYEDINGFLRGKTDLNLSDDDILEHVENIDRAVEKGILTRDIQVFRGIGWHKRVRKNDVIEDFGYSSSSLLKSIADGWPTDHALGRGDVPTVLEFVIPKGTPVAYLEPFTMIKGEHEILLARGARFEILSSRKVGKTVYAKARLKW